VSDQKPRLKKARLDLIPWELDFLHWRIPLMPLDCAGGESLLAQIGAMATIEDAAAAFAHGAAKYGADNWKLAKWDDAARRTYYGAICRHLVAHNRGELADPESGAPHLGHALASAMIFAWHEKFNNDYE